MSSSIPLFQSLPHYLHFYLPSFLYFFFHSFQTTISSRITNIKPYKSRHESAQELIFLACFVLSLQKVRSLRSLARASSFARADDTLICATSFSYTCLRPSVLAATPTANKNNPQLYIPINHGTNTHNDNKNDVTTRGNI